MPDLTTNHSALTTTIHTIILTIEAAALNGSAFLPTAPASTHATVQHPLQTLDAEIQTLKTTLTTWRRKGEKMDFMHRELQHIANNPSLTHSERAVKIADVLDDIGRIDDSCISSFRAFTSVLARLYTLLALPLHQPLFRHRAPPRQHHFPPPPPHPFPTPSPTPNPPPLAHAPIPKSTHPR